MSWVYGTIAWDCICRLGLLGWIWVCSQDSRLKSQMRPRSKSKDLVGAEPVGVGVGVLSSE